MSFISLAAEFGRLSNAGQGFELAQAPVSLAPKLLSKERLDLLGQNCAWDIYNDVGRDVDVSGNSGFRDDTMLLHHLKPADMVGDRFRILRLIGKGGMGNVYEAEDLQLRQRVALKTIRSEISAAPEAVERFKREVQLARKVTHPNVCRIYDLGLDRSTGNSDKLFLTMELLDGETLSSRIKRGIIPLSDALHLISDMADALSAVHAAGVVLRDFKSANVMLVGFDRTRAIITDFGLAQALPCERERKSFRSERATVGTIDYMAPEQIRGGTVTPAADMYAFGVVMYEMVTGQRPFIGTSVAEIALRHLNESPLPPHELAPNLDDKWDNVILGCLRKKPSERFSSPSSVKDAILAFA